MGWPIPIKSAGRSSMNNARLSLVDITVTGVLQEAGDADSRSQQQGEYSACTRSQQQGEYLIILYTSTFIDCLICFKDIIIIVLLL